ncbi:MAG: non-ribosomal peptide synthetase [Nocardioidaceae bacterium]
MTSWLPVPELFRATAGRWPGRIAVECPSRGLQLTYARLERRAATACEALGQADVQPGSYVGLSLVDRVNFCVGLLGSWRRGAVPVPVDPHVGEQYVRSLCAAVPLAATFTDDGAARDDPIDLRVLSRGCRAAAVPWPEGWRTAYVMHTSGSTGSPKGVAVSHKALGSYCTAFAEAVGVTGEDRFLQVAPPTFDVVLEELLPVWAAGGTAVLSSARPLDPASLLDTLISVRVTLAEITTSYWSLLVRYLERSRRRVPPCLRLLIVGGDQAPPWLFRRSLELGLPIAHVYGVTEAAVTSTIKVFDSSDRPENASVGMPLRNTTVRVVDRHGRPAAQGTQGEIWIGGDGLADGYLGDPHLTTRRFVPASGPRPPAGRYYRTGDLGRQLGDGTLEVLGRMDAQTKIKGIRVEPAEVEESLLQAPGVAAGAVVPVGGAARRRLAAYVVPRPNARGDVGKATRGHLAERLPPHLVPSSVTVVSELPFTRHGKIDRRRLQSRTEPRPAPAPPQPGSGALASVAAVWTDVLGAAPRHHSQNFFDAGGDSLALLEVVVRLQELGYPVTVDDCLRWSTVEGLAAHLDSKDGPRARIAPGSAQRRQELRRCRRSGRRGTR